ncbi:MAG: Calx-beta domain-containing protein [Pseudohongiellaceae bacterium]
MTAAAGGSIGNFTGSGTRYTFVFTATDVNDTGGIVVKTGSFTDVAGNGNGFPVVTHTIDVMPPTVSIAAGTSPVIEAAGANAEFVLTADVTLGTALDVAVTLAQTGDYIASANLGNRTVTIAAGADTLTLTVAIVNDNTDEPDGSLTARLTTDGTSYDVNTAATSATVNLADDDDTTYTLGTASELEGTALEFVLTRSTNVTGSAESFTYAITYDGQANPADGEDFPSNDDLTGNAMIAAGQNTATFMVRTNDDNTDEYDETFVFDVLMNTDSIGTVVGTIRNNDMPPPMMVSAVAVTEGSNLMFVANLNPASGKTITVDYATMNGTAEQPGDYTARTGSLTFMAGTTSLAVAVPTTGDRLYEANETVTLRFRNPINIAAASFPGDNLNATGSITDNDDIALGIAVVSGKRTVAEADGNVLEFVVDLGTMATGVQDDLTVGYDLNGDADPGNDYIDPGTSLVFSNTDGSSKTIAVTVRNDDTEEEDETVILTLTAPTAPRVTLRPGMATATGIIEINDQPPTAISVTIAADASPITEGTAATFTVTASQAPSGSDLTVRLDIFGADSFRGEVPDTVTITDGGTSGTVSIATLPDTLYEAHDTITARVQGGVGYRPGMTAASATVSVQDDDDIQLTIAVSGSASVAEADGNTLEFEVDLGTPTGVDVDNDLVVAYGLSGNATPGTDYTNPGATLTFSAGDGGSKVITVAVLDDEIAEGDETVVLALSAPTQSRITLAAGTSATGTITDDEMPVISIVAGATAITEGEDAVFVISSSHRPMDDINIDLTARQIGDFIRGARPRAVMLPGGQTSATLTLATVPDTVDEPDGSLSIALNLSTELTDAGYSANADANAVTVALNDNDGPNINVSPVRADESDGQLVFVVTLSAVPIEDTDVDWSTASGGSNPASNSDYTAASGTLNFTTAGGGTTMNITVAVIDDNLVELNETFLLRLTDATNDGNITGGGVAVGTIVNDDFPEISISRNVASVTEGDPATFTVTASPVPFGNLSVSMATSQQGGFIRGTPAGTVVIGVSGTATYTINTREVSGVSTGSVTAIVQPGSDYTLSQGNTTATVAVRDSSVRQVNVAASQANVTEGTDSTVTFTISLNSMPSATGETAVTVDYATEGAGSNPATAGDDYTAVSGTLIFAANETSKTVVVNITNDNLYEQFNEQFQMRISNARPSVSNQIGTSTAPVTITDDESVTLSIAPASGKDIAGEAAGTTLDYVVSLAGAAGGLQSDLTVSYTLSGTADAGGSAAEGRADYTAPSGSLIFASGTATSQTIAVSVLDDDIAEGDETVILTLSTPTAPRVTVNQTMNEATGTITDDEMAVISITAEDTSITEGDPAVFVISSTHAPMNDIAIDLEVNSTESFTGPLQDTAVTIPGGSRTVTLSIATIDDTNDEADGFVSLHLNLSSELTNAGYSANPNASAATITIVDDDQPSVSISVSPASDVEGNNAVFTITATPAPYAGITLTVPLTVSTVGDYTIGATPPASVVLTNAAATAIFTVATEDDEDREANGTITATLSAPTSDAYTLGTSQAVFTVQDNDTPNLSIRATGTDGTPVSSVIEGNTIVFTITPSFPPRENLSVALSVSTAGDYFDGPVALSSIMLTVGQTSAAITVTTVDDENSETDGSITVSLTSPVSANANYAVVAPASAQVTIQDDDGLNEEQVQEINAALLPYLGITAADVLAKNISERIDTAFNSPTANPNTLIAIGNSSVPEFLMSQLQSRHNQREQMRAAGEWRPDEAFRFNSQDINFSITLGGRNQAETGEGMTSGISGTGTSSLQNTSSDIGTAIGTTAGVSTGSLQDTSSGTGSGSTTGTGTGNGNGGFADVITLWGRGFYHDMNAEKDSIGFDGKITGAMVGLDAIRSNLVGGLALSTLKSEANFTYQDLAGIHTTKLTAINPYIAHRSDDGVQLWATLGYAGGDIEVVEADDKDATNRYTSDITMKSASVGGYGPLYQYTSASGDTLSLGFIGNGLMVQMDEDQVSLDAARVRVGLKLEQRTNTSSGNTYASNATLNYRRDFGDGFTGDGVEIGAGLEMGAPSAGLALDIHARALVSSSDDIEEWGVNIGLAWAAHQDRRGLSLSFKPQWGAVDSQEQHFWNNSTADFSHLNNDDMAANYNLEMKYGIQLAEAIGEDEGNLLELFARGDNNKRLELGANFGLGQNTTMELFARSDLNQSQNFTLGANYALGETLSIGYEAIMTPDIPLTTASPTGASATSIGATPSAVTTPDTTQPATARYLPYLRQSTPELNPFGQLNNSMFTLPGMNPQQPASATTPGLNHRAYLRYQKRF